MISLLGDREGDSNDPIDLMLQSAEAMRQQQDQYQRLTNFQRQREPAPFRNSFADQVSDREIPKTEDGARRLRQQQALRERVLDLLENRPIRSPSNPLLDSVSSEDIGVGLDQAVGDEAAESTSQNFVDLGDPGGGSAGSGGGGASTSKLITNPVSSQGSAMGQSANPISRGAQSGNGAEENGNAVAADSGSDQLAVADEIEAIDEQEDLDAGNANEDVIEQPDADSTDGANDQGSFEQSDSEVAEPTILRADAEQILAAQPSADGLRVTTAASTDDRGEGRFVLVAELGAGLESEQLVDALLVRNGIARSLGELSVDGSAETARLVGVGRVLPGDEVLLHRHDGDGLLGDVSTRYVVAESVDQDNDGVDEVVEQILADGNQDGIEDSIQPNVATLPDAINGLPATLDAGNARLVGVRGIEPQEDRSNNRLPLGLFEFQLHDIPIGGIQAVDIHLPENEPVEGWFKEDPATGRLYEFFFDGETGAVETDFGYTLYLQDGGRGDEDGVANGVIVDPGGPGFAGSLTITEDRDLSVLNEYGGSSSASAGDYREISYG